MRRKISENTINILYYLNISTITFTYIPTCIHIFNIHKNTHTLTNKQKIA